MLVLVLSPQHRHGLVRGAVFLYVFGLIAAGLWALATRGERSRSRATQRRVRFLVLIGALAAAFTLADFLWFIGAPLPPVGAVLSIVFLFVLAESMTRDRLVDLYEILGQLVVSTALAFCLAGIFYVFVVLFGGFDTMYLGAILAAIVILVLFEPLRQKVEEYMRSAFYRERVDLERALLKARSQLVHVLELEEMQQVVMSTLEESRRVTGAALYLRDPLGAEFALGASFGPPAPQRIDGVSARPLLEQLTTGASVVLEEVAHRITEHRRAGLTHEAEADARLLAAAELLGPLKGGVCLAIHAEDRTLLGIVVLVDDRVSDAFSQDEVALLESLAVQIGVVIENSRQYRRMQERDRLAALGQMAAGLAHEVKNPLGAIKGAAQLLKRSAGAIRSRARCRANSSTSFSRKWSGWIASSDRCSTTRGLRRAIPGAVDVNAVVRRTLRVLASDPLEGCELRSELGDDLPLVRADAEQLRQVLMNLVKNAVQAMNGSGIVSVTTRLRLGGDARWVSASDTAFGLGRGQRAGPGAGHRAASAEEPVRPVLHHQGEGHGAGPCHQPAHDRGDGWPHRGILPGRLGIDVHGPAAERGRSPGHTTSHRALDRAATRRHGPNRGALRQSRPLTLALTPFPAATIHRVSITPCVGYGWGRGPKRQRDGGACHLAQPKLSFAGVNRWPSPQETNDVTVSGFGLLGPGPKTKTSERPQTKLGNVRSGVLDRKY